MRVVFCYASWWMDPWPWLGVALLGGMFWAGRRGVKMPMVWVFVVSLACVLLPYVGILRVNQHHANRFLLLVVVVCAWGGAMLLERMAAKVKWLGWAALPALLAWGMETHRYVGAWESDVALWLHVYRQDPRHIGATTKIGRDIAVQRGRFEAAEKLLRVAVEVAPLRPQAWNSLGLVFLLSGVGSAEGIGGTGIAFEASGGVVFEGVGDGGRDKSVTPLWGLGALERMRGRLGEAEKYWRKGLWLPKVSSRLVLDLAELWVSQGRVEDAKRLVVRMRGRFARQEKIEAWLKKHGKR